MKFSKPNWAEYSLSKMSENKKFLKFGDSRFGTFANLKSLIQKNLKSVANQTLDLL